MAAREGVVGDDAAPGDVASGDVARAGASIDEPASAEAEGPSAAQGARLPEALIDEARGPQNGAVSDSRQSPWDALLQAGLSLAAVLRDDDGSTPPAHDWIERDPASGARRLVIPVPPAETVQRLADALGEIAGALAGGRR